MILIPQNLKSLLFLKTRYCLEYCPGVVCVCLFYSPAFNFGMRTSIIHFFSELHFLKVKKVSTDKFVKSYTYNGKILLFLRTCILIILVTMSFKSFFHGMLDAIQKMRQRIWYEFF